MVMYVPITDGVTLYARAVVMTRRGVPYRYVKLFGDIAWLMLYSVTGVHARTGAILSHP